MSDNYQTTLDEMSAIGGQIEGEAEAIDEQATALAQSVLGPSDFGGENYHSYGESYAAGVDDNLVKAVQEYARQARALAENITQSYRTYSALEDDEAARMQELG
ncbi:MULTISPECIES: hypothetical protein [Actinoalloteichus]|uniref:Uncharacterized protein n=1 Tax=Actinoalloteichus fjordicus TaxID=1612552 RepID=A0AAC9LHT6_9PSEU|nr:MULTISPECIES: hypothetical protein [Actinoalloteichus]APU17606.1 hypothetical protein UA74_28025 [Actinoalloteichus fjordicus]APU23682.1 hypothetical protein UA75_28555 [Actinoalloteichus sp. GBA129-24]